MANIWNTLSLINDVSWFLLSQVEKVAELTSKLQEHEHKASYRDVLDEQAIQLHKELQASHTAISEQVNKSFFSFF